MKKINELLARKRLGIEFGIEPRIEIINNFVENTLKHFSDVVNTFDPGKKPNKKILEEGFIKIIEYVENTRLPSVADG